MNMRTFFTLKFSFHTSKRGSICYDVKGLSRVFFYSDNVLYISGPSIEDIISPTRSEIAQSIQDTKKNMAGGNQIVIFFIFSKCLFFVLC